MFLWEGKNQGQGISAATCRVEAASLKEDMWVSITMNIYLAVTCHYVEDPMKLNQIQLQTLVLPPALSLENGALREK